MRKDIIDYPNSAKGDDYTRTFNTGDIPQKNHYDRKVESRKSKKKNHKRRILICVIAAVLGLIIGVGLFLKWYSNHLLSSIDHIEVNPDATILNENGDEIRIDELRKQIETVNPLIEDEDISNFLLIGVDSRSKSLSADGTGALADVIMIMSVDNDAGTIKLVSIARDSYAYVPGYSNPMKINSAMSKGGPDLLQLTIESTLRIQIDGYAFVNFYNMAGAIDAVGGVYCNVSTSERDSQAGLNDNLREINQIYGYDPEFQKVENSGDIWLNGRQAVAYARIRHIDSDYARSERQVEVLRSMLSQFMNKKLTEKATCMDDILQLVSTNITDKEITRYALDFLPSITDAEIQYFQLPLEGFFNSGMYDQEWSIRNNWNMTIPYVQEFLYGRTTDFDPVADIPQSPSDSSCPSSYDVQGHISK